MDRICFFPTREDGLWALKKEGLASVLLFSESCPRGLGSVLFALLPFACSVRTQYSLNRLLEHNKIYEPVSSKTWYLEALIFHNHVAYTQTKVKK